MGAPSITSSRVQAVPPQGPQAPRAPPRSLVPCLHPSMALAFFVPLSLCVSSCVYFPAPPSRLSLYLLDFCLTPLGVGAPTATSHSPPVKLSWKESIRLLAACLLSEATVAPCTPTSSPSTRHSQPFLPLVYPSIVHSSSQLSTHPFLDIPPPISVPRGPSSLHVQKEDLSVQS